jgi:diguanylate cyclase (GGDEF)-like protein
VALIAATVILFEQPLRFILDAVRDVEGRFHLDLLPALLLLAFAFTFHQHRKHMQATAQARAAAADAAVARRQSKTLQQLMALGRDLANALDAEALQQVLWRHLPALAPNRRFWMVLRRHDQWQTVLCSGSTDDRHTDELEQLAARTLRGDGPMVEPGRASFPMLAAGSVVGVLGVDGAPALTEDEQNSLGAAAAVLAIGVRNMHLFLDTRELSLRDTLTGCFNRAYGLEALDNELRRARRTGLPLSIMLVDVDEFKTINDTLGHLRGDEVLARMGAQLSAALRSTDLRCRYGGDEFLVILPETPSLGAQQVAEAIRQSVAQTPIGEDDPTTITLSIGVASAVPGELDAKALIARADQALYQSKGAGRDCVRVAIPPSLAESHAASAAAAGTYVARAGTR